MKYLSPDLAYELFSLQTASIALISAPTGSGKTTMITKYLWPLCRMYEKHMIMFVNRRILKSQVGNTILKEIGVSDDISDEGCIALDYLTIASYQYLEKRLENDRIHPDKLFIGGIACSHYDFVIFDEAHFFFYDSLFSLETIFLQRIPRVFKRAVRIYLSATMNPIRDQLLCFENIQDTEWDPYCYEWMYPGRFYTHIPFVGNIGRIVKEYSDVIPDYSYFQPVPYRDDEDLCSHIQEEVNAGSREKWIVFTNSIEKGQKMKGLLNEHGVSCAFIASNETLEVDKDAVEDIFKSSKFSQQVLVTTNVIDNGVSIQDKAVTRIVLSGLDEITAIQQAGRIRVKNKKKTKIQLWVCLRNKRYFSFFRKNYQKDLDTLLDFEKKNKEQRIELLFQADTQSLRKYVLLRDGNYTVNPLAKWALQYRIQEYEQNIEWLEQKGEYGFYERTLFWFGLKKTTDSDISSEKTESSISDRLEIIHREDIKKFEDFVKAYRTDAPITKEQLDKYAKTFKMLHDNAYGPHKKSNPKAPYGLNILNNILGKYSLGVQIESVRNSEKGNRVTKYMFREVDNNDLPNTK